MPSLNRILITRPWEDAEPLAARLTVDGHRALIEPMLEIHYLDEPVPNLDTVQGLLFTSANGVRAFARGSAERGLAVYAVGNATAAAARAAGFAAVSSADGDVTALARLVGQRCQPAAGALLHVAASVRAGDLSGLLEATGFTVQRAVLYEARPAAALSPATAEALATGTLEAVMLFSPRTARSLAALIAAAGLTTACHSVDALCLSEAVAKAAGAGGTLAWRRRMIASRPDLEAMLDLLNS